MRKSRIAAAKTRKDLVRAASQEIRSIGLSNINLADVTDAVGVTRGAFYRHFTSREQLVCEALALAFEEVVSKQASTIKTHPTDSAVSLVGRNYLTIKHASNAADGCPLAAIGSEIGRSTAAVRAVARDGMRQMQNLISPCTVDTNTHQLETSGLAELALMVGAITLSRMVDNETDQVQILDAALNGLLRLGSDASSRNECFPSQTN